MSDIHLPRGPIGSEPDLWSWYGNIAHELDDPGLTTVQREYLAAYYLEAGLLRPTRRRFFRRHYCQSFAQAAAFLAKRSGQRRILDLGCGAGTQALYLALLGLEVVAVDLDDLALEILIRRKELFESRAGRSLAIEVRAGNAFDIEYATAGPFDGLWSMFAFNMMQPSTRLMEIIAPHLTTDARIAILDGNNRSLLARALPSRRRDVWSPLEAAAGLASHGFTVWSHRGGVSLPPFAWNLCPFAAASAVDHRLCDNWLVPASHLLLAGREPKPASVV